MASDSTSSRSSSTADSYIGCLISLTSKSEIRYEGVLYNINPEESSIGLRNVRSFGTEGRKKDGQQIPPSDKVYEYILFRGTDIKDLQVKSSPPVQPIPPISTDPAIIQSQYPRPVTTLTSLPAASGSLTDFNSNNTQHELTGSSYQGHMPLYQSGGNIGSWGASPNAPNANGSGLALPMYWQGYYGAPNGLPHLQQQSLFQPPPGLSMPSSLQQPSLSMPSSMQQPNLSMPSSLQQPNLSMPSSLQQPNFSMPLMQQSLHFPNLNPSLPTGPSKLPEFPSSLFPVSSSSPSITSTPLPPSDLPSTLPPAASATLGPETLPASVASKAAAVSLPTVTVAANLPSLTPFTGSSPDISDAVPPVNKPIAIPGSSLPYHSVSPLTPAIVGSSNSSRPEVPAPSLVTPGQLLQPAAVVSSSQPTTQKDVEVVPVSSTVPTEPSVPVSAESQPPILPLPVTSWPNHRPSGDIQHSYGYRGRGRGRGTAGSRPVARFTEDFDFIAMNEKFKKDEVWGHLGKSNKSHSKDHEGEENASDEGDSEEEDIGDVPKLEVKPVYNKDDFFDTLSSNVLDQDSQSGRIRYSEQIKIDTETFGDFSRHRGGWRGRGGRGGGGGGRFRGGYYGRGGYGYGGRGRGGSMSNRP